jgi:hypothetical protein
VDRPVEEYFEERPDRIIVLSVDGRPWLSRKGKKIDFARRDAMNRRLGQLGEVFAVEVEKRRLLVLGRDDLAAKVETLSVSRPGAWIVLLGHVSTMKCPQHSQEPGNWVEFPLIGSLDRGQEEQAAGLV